MFAVQYRVAGKSYWKSGFATAVAAEYFIHLKTSAYTWDVLEWTGSEWKRVA